jgi:O-antigen/teichoic acid export membrane protein
MRKDWFLVAQTSAAKIYWVLATLLTTVITARFLGPAGRGVLVASIGWVTMFSTFGYLSLSQVIIFLAAGKKKEEWLGSTLGSLLAILSVVAIVGWLIAAILFAASGGRAFHNLDVRVLLAAFAALPFMLWIENGNGILMSLGKLHVLNSAQVAGGTASVLLTFVAVGALKSGIVGALIAVGLSNALIVIISLGYIARQADGIRVEKPVVRELLTGGAKLHLNAVGTYLFTQANVLILNNFRSSRETGYYQLAVQLVTAMQIIPMAVSVVCYSLVSRDGPDKAWPQQRKLLGEVLIVVVALSVVGYLVAPMVISFAFGKAFLPSVPLFRILLFTVVGMTLSIVMASQWISRGLFTQAAFLTVATGLLTVACNYLVVPAYGMFGAAWVSVGTYVVSIVGNGIMFLWVQRRWKRSLESV